MIAAILIENFKSIKELKEVPIKPLTAISGINSSGKSTILQSILMIIQTMQSRYQRHPLITNGELVHLGTSSDILNFERQNEPLRIGLDLDFQYLHLEQAVRMNFNKENVRRRTFSIVLDIQFKRSRTDKADTLELTQGHYVVADLSGSTNELSITKETGESVFSIKQVYPEQILNQPYSTVQVSQFLPTHYFFERSTQRTFQEEMSQVEGAVDSVEWRSDRLEAEYNQELSPPVRKVLDSIAVQSKASQVIDDELVDRLNTATTLDGVLNFAQLLSSVQYKYFIDNLKTPALKEKIATELGDEVKNVRSRIPSKLANGFTDFREYCSNQIHYLGPLRDDPRTIYAVPDNTEFRHVGIKGEYTAAMLEQYGDTEVTYPIPSTDISKAIPEIAMAPLANAVSIWLHYMGLADGVDVIELPNIGYQLKVEQAHTQRGLALTNVGVGVSQVLPTLVMGLLVDSPATLLIEQPELHLHPKVQSGLGDFLLGLTYCGKQCIVETHSEHIINRLRLRIAQDDTDKNFNYVGILFVEKGSDGSDFREVKPNEYGAIHDWPEGFFDQAEEEANKILRAAIKKRQAKSIK